MSYDKMVLEYQKQAMIAKGFKGDFCNIEVKTAVQKEKPKEIEEKMGEEDIAKIIKVISQNKPVPMPTWKFISPIEVFKMQQNLSLLSDILD